MRVQTINKRINTMKLDKKQVIGELELKIETFLEKHNVDAIIDVSLDSVDIWINDKIPSILIDKIESQFLLENVEVQETYRRGDPIKYYYSFEHKKIHKYQ